MGFCHSPSSDYPWLEVGNGRRGRSLAPLGLDNIELELTMEISQPASQPAASARLAQRLKDAYPFVSISHKNNRLVGLGASRPCGIDIEERRARHPSFECSVIGPAERGVIGDPILAWSIKEACFKVFNDGYEAADFRIALSRRGHLVVLSRHYVYQVAAVVGDGYVLAAVFVVDSVDHV